MTIGGDHYVLKMKPAFLLQTRTFYIDRMQTQELQKSEWRLRFFLKLSSEITNRKLYIERPFFISLKHPCLD